jgi:hypothetical protein
MPVTSTGSLTSTMTMHVSEDQIEDIIFGRDWFNYCSAEPFATMDLIEPGMCLCFGASPQSSIRACSSLGQILIIPLLCLTNELSQVLTTAVAKQCLSTLDVDVPFGPGAAFGSDAANSTLDFNMGSSSSTIIASNISNVSVDNLDYDSHTDLLLAVENLMKDSLLSLAQAHMITFPIEM